MSENIKEIKIDGVSDGGGGIYRRGAGRGSSRKRSAMRAERLDAPVIEPVAPATALAAAPAPAAAAAAAPAAAAAATPMPKKIVLAPKKRVTKIVFTKKRSAAPPSTPNAPTREARKLTLRLASHTRRINRGRRLHNESREMPIEEVKTKLVAKGIIKPTSKAPEAVLRQLYADAMSIAEPAL